MKEYASARPGKMPLSIGEECQAWEVATSARPGRLLHSIGEGCTGLGDTDILVRGYTCLAGNHNMFHGINPVRQQV